MSRILRIEHLARVEGHGGITVELDGETLREVRFDVFEGLRLLEGLVAGRSFEDVAPIVSRICAICSVAHSLTSIRATENAFGVEVTPQTERLRDLLLRGENIESHALHLFLLAVPDYLGFPSAPAMAAEHPEAVALALRLKKLGNLVQETLGGRAIHPVRCVPGGFSQLPTRSELERLRDALEEGVRDGLAAVAFLAGALPAPVLGGAGAFAALRPTAGYGYGGDGAGEVIFATEGRRHTVAATDFAATVAERPVPHSHAKHSRFEGRPFMVGALARVTLFGDRLGKTARAVARQLGLTAPSTDPLANNAAQAVELAHDLEVALATVSELLAAGLAPEPPVPVTPRAGAGTAIIEAPRGILLHSYSYDDAGRVLSADVITPTALNAASVEESFRRVIAGDPAVEDAILTHALERVARAYDPCISCSVHLVRRRGA